MDDIEKLYHEYYWTLKNFARKAARATGIEEDDLMSQANLIFMECAQREEKKEFFDKYLSNALYWKLYRYARKRTKQKAELSEITSCVWHTRWHARRHVQERKRTDIRGTSWRRIDIAIEKDTSCLLDVTWENLNRDARQIVDLCFDPPEKLFNERLQKVTKKRLYEYLKNVQNWKRSRILAGFRIVEKAIA